MGEPLEKSIDSTTGISEDDQREILQEIERVAAENRINVDDDAFHFQAVQNGARFPIVVNLIGLAVLGAGIFFLSQVFQNNEAEIQNESRAVVTAEGRLIAEIRAETERELAKREEEIADIRSQLASISEERAALASDVAGRIQRREEQLRAEFEAELEAERRRLIALNLSEEEIEARLAEFSRVKEREFEQRLTQFRRQVAEEQERLENELDTLESQFNRSLANANAERQALVEESEQRLRSLQADFEQQLEAQEQELTQTEQELARLAERQQRVALLRGQIRGLYSQIATALDGGDLSVARARLDDLRALLNDDQILRIPDLRDQRPVELFVLSSLESLISFEERFGDPQTLDRLNDASSIREMRELAGRAAAALEADNEVLAETLYRQVIETLPAVSESHSFLASSVGETDDDALEQIDAAAAPVMESARLALGAEQWETAVRRYAEVVRLFPQSRFRQEAIAGIEQATGSLAGAADTDRSELVERVAFLQAERDDLAGQLADTENALTVAQQEVVDRANDLAVLEAELAAARAGSTAGAEELAAAERRAEELQSEVSIQQNRIATLERTLATRNTELESTEVELLSTLDELATSQAQTAQAQVVISDLNEELAAARSGEGGGEGMTPETREELTRLREMESRLAEAEAAYDSYLSQASTIAGAGVSGADVLSARVALERFLTAEAMRRHFPDLSEEIERFDSAFLASGRENALLDVADLLTELSLAGSDGERRRLINSARGQLAGSSAGGGAQSEAAASEFLTELEALLAAGN